MSCKSNSDNLEWRKLNGEFNPQYTRIEGNLLTIFYFTEDVVGNYVCIDRNTNQEVQQFYVTGKDFQPPVQPDLKPTGGGPISRGT